MAVINPHVHTEQEVLNSSFDETFGVLVTEPVRRNTGATALEYFNPATEEKQDALNLAVHAEDSAHVTGDVGVPIWGVRVDAFPPDGGVFGADGDYTPIATNYKGDVKTSVQDSALPTGAATAAKQDTGNTSVASIDAKTPALGQALAAASVPVILPSATITTLTPPAAITGFATSAKQDTIIDAIKPLSGAGVNGTRALTAANTWYSVPSTVPSSAYVLVVSVENAAGTIRFGFDNTGTPSATNGNIAPGILEVKLAASQVVYFASSVAGDDVNWSTKVI